MKINESKLHASPEEAIDPSFTSAQAIATISQAGKNTRTITKLEKEIQQVCKRVKEGDLSDLEDILVSQAIALNVLSSQLLTKGNAALLEPTILRVLPNYCKEMLGIALKAQSQTRETIKTINDLKNPKKTTFIKNQLNSIQMQLERRLELLEEEKNGTKVLDGTTQAVTSPENQAMETLGTFDRSKNPTGQKPQ